MHEHYKNGDLVLENELQYYIVNNKNEKILLDKKYNYYFDNENVYFPIVNTEIINLKSLKNKKLYYEDNYFLSNVKNGLLEKIKKVN